MSDVTVLDAEAVVFDGESFNVAEYSKQMFGMYNGEIVHATLSFENSLVNVVIEQFGKAIVMTTTKDGWFNISGDVSLSPVFLSKIIQFGGRAVIKAPETLIDAMRGLLNANARQYDLVSNEHNS